MPLYDFLYQDSSRLNSFQQQLGTSTIPETLDALRNGGHLRADLRSGGLVELTGELFLLSRGLLEFATSAPPEIPDDFEIEDDEGDEDEEDDFDGDDEYDDEDESGAYPDPEFNPIRSLFESIGMPSIFVVRGAKESAGGAFNEAFLADSVASFYLRSAPAAIQRVTVVGISEPPAPPNESDLPDGIIEAAFPMMSTIFGPMLPDGALRITPVLMYREIVSSAAPGGPRKMIR